MSRKVASPLHSGIKVRWNSLGPSGKSALVVVALLAGGLGCASDKGPTQPPEVVDPFPAASTPEGLLQRLKASLETRNRQAYIDLLTDDFEFEFSAATDPSLPPEYPNGWRTTDEDTMLTHLFGGFRNAEGDSLFPAASISIVVPTTAMDDPEHLDSLNHFKTAFISSASRVVVLQYGDPTGYQIGGGTLSLVRGNAAVLRSGRPATSDYWYIRRWEDNASAAAKAPPKQMRPESGLSSGAFRDFYRR